MLIAKRGDYELVQQTFLGRKKRSTFTIEICKRVEGSLLTLCYLRDGNVVFCDDRFISMVNTVEDLTSLKLLLKILYGIYATDETEIK